MSSELPHRDDVPFPVAEAIEQAIKEAHPEFKDYKVVFAGDVPEGQMPAELAEMADEMTAHLAQSFVGGMCADCGKKIPCDWPPEDEVELPEGWVLYENPGASVPYVLVCPECEEAATKLEVSIETDPNSDSADAGSDQ